MLRIGRVEQGVGKHAVCKFGDPAYHEMVNVIRNCPNGNSFVPSMQWPELQSSLATGTYHSRVLVRLAKLKSEIHKPLFELFRKPWACGKAANEKYKLFMINQV